MAQGEPLEPWLKGAVEVDGKAQGGARPQTTFNPTPPSSVDFYTHKLREGVAGGLGAYGDVIPRLYELGKAGIGFSNLPGILSAVTGKPPSTFMPEPGNANPVTDYLKEALGVAGPAVAPSKGAEILGGVVEGAGAGLGSGPGATTNVLSNLGKMIALGGAAGLGSEIGGQISDNPIARILGGLTTGVVAPAVAQGRLAGTQRMAQLVQNQGQQAALQNAAPIVRDMVNEQVRSSVAGTPGAARGLEEGLALSQKIPGFKPSIAEMTGAPGAAAMQSRYAQTTPETLNAEVARVEANRQAIRDFYDQVIEKGGAPSSVRSEVNRGLAQREAQAQAQAEQVAGRAAPADQLQTGQKLSEIAAAEKVAAKPPIDAAYQAAYDASGGAKTSAQGIVDQAESILGQKLSQLKPETAPNLTAAIARIFKGKEGEPPIEIVGEKGNVLSTISREGKAAEVTLQDLHDIRVAVGKDVALAKRSADPAAATKLNNLRGLYGPIDEAIDKLPGKDLYAAATQKYKTEYVPRFKEGTPAQVFRDTSLNEPRILPDKFISEFFKSDAQAGVTRSGQFAALFGENPEARQLAKAGILDLYRQRVVDPNTGTINLAAHNRFVNEHSRTLDAFAQRGVNAAQEIADIGAQAGRVAEASRKLNAIAKDLRYDSADELAKAALGSQKIMGNLKVMLGPEGQTTLTRMIMDKAFESGTGAGMRDFLDKNSKTLGMIASKEQMANLKDIARALEMAEAAPIKGMPAAAGPDVLKAKTGLSMATVWAQYRATSAGRQGLATAMFNLAAPVMTRLSQTQFTDIMEQALHSPETARNLRNFLLAQGGPAANTWATKLLDGLKTGGQLLWSAKGPILKYAVGTPYYPENLGRTAIPLSVVSEKEKQ